MSSNVIKAFLKIIENSDVSVDGSAQGGNRVTSVGDGLEIYVKDAFAGILGAQEYSENEKMEIYNNIFSFQNSSSRPPDLIIKNGDAIEVKKIEDNPDKELALNSSSPKTRITKKDSKITNAVKDTLSDNESKDLLYVVGTVDGVNLKNMWMVYGDCFVQDIDFYNSIFNDLKSKMKKISEEIPNVNANETKEFMRLNNIDLLGRTHLRVRAMYILENPNKIFEYLLKDYLGKNYICLLMREKKFKGFPEEDKNKIKKYCSKIKIKDPENQNQFIDAILAKSEL